MKFTLPFFVLRLSFSLLGGQHNHQASFVHGYKHEEKGKMVTPDGRHRAEYKLGDVATVVTDKAAQNYYLRRTQALGEWDFCTASSQCTNGCCSSKFSDDGKLKCTPLDGGFQSDICVRSTGTTGGGGTNAPAPTLTPAPTPVSGDGSCGGGNHGNGICADGACCSEFGWCGTSIEHCGGGAPTPGPAPTSGRTITSPAIVLTVEQVQAGINVKDNGVSVSQYIVDEINKVTANDKYSLYHQLAFVAHTIWESGSYRLKEEQNTANHENYQDCDWNMDGIQYPDNGKLFYGRGFLQLSWCANYKAYGADRMFNNDPNLFYNQPELVATDDFYAMDSAAWFYESQVLGTTAGEFGETTNKINGALECSSGSSSAAAKRRYEIFVSIANAVEMTGYTERGCYGVGAFDLPVATASEENQSSNLASGSQTGGSNMTASGVRAKTILGFLIPLMALTATILSW